MRGVSLDDIADATKIGTRLLRALEEEHFELLPGGIFNKGFVRAYSKYLGLNEEEAVADYLEAAGEITPDPRVIAEQNSSRIDRSGAESGPSRQAGFPIIPGSDSSFAHRGRSRRLADLSGTSARSRSEAPSSLSREFGRQRNTGGKYLKIYADAFHSP